MGRNFQCGSSFRLYHTALKVLQQEKKTVTPEPGLGRRLIYSGTPSTSVWIVECISLVVVSTLWCHWQYVCNPHRYVHMYTIHFVRCTQTYIKVFVTIHSWLEIPITVSIPHELHNIMLCGGCLL